ncbi:MAG: hypothetical protein P8Z81_05120 [Deinococcales bacterium]
MRPFKRMRARWWLLVVAPLMLMVGEAAAQSLGSGTEVFVTDASGQRLVGYGVVQASGLQLQLDNVSQNLVVMLVSPGGSVTTLQAVRGSDGSLLVATVGGSYETLSAYFGTWDVALTVVAGNRGNGTPGRPSLPSTAAAASHTSPTGTTNQSSHSDDNPSTSKSNNGKNDN